VFLMKLALLAWLLVGLAVLGDSLAERLVGCDRQGNLELYSAANIVRRQALRCSGPIIKAVKAHWAAIASTNVHDGARTHKQPSSLRVPLPSTVFARGCELLFVGGG
jgi:hypothetical protein